MPTNEINLDSARAVRAEISELEAPKVRFKGKTFELPIELPFGAFVRLASTMKSLQGAKPEDIEPLEALAMLEKLVRALFKDNADEFLDLDPSIDDLNNMLDALQRLYGVTAGEASALPDSASVTTTH